jgi:hypothetical protein
MEIPDFLEKFFYLFEDDAKVLATMMGYVEPTETKEMELAEAESEMQDWIKSRMSAFEIVKSLAEADNVVESLAQLDENQYLTLLKDQELVEKAFKKIDKAEKAKEKEQKVAAKPVVKLVTKGDSSSNEPVSTQESTVVKSAEDTSVTREVKQEVTSSDVIAEKSAVTKGKLMTKEPQVIEQEVEVIAKAEFDIVNKALEEQKVQLEKAMQVIADLEAEKKAQILKAREDQVKAAVKDQAKSAVIFKAIKDIQDEDFTAVVKTLGELAASAEQSELFVEKGASTQEETTVTKSALERMLEAKYSK